MVLVLSLPKDFQHRELLIYFFVQSQKTKGQTPTQNESPLDILKMRYAKGEIAREEYEKQNFYNCSNIPIEAKALSSSYLINQQMLRENL